MDVHAKSRLTLELSTARRATARARPGERTANLTFEAVTAGGTSSGTKAGSWGCAVIIMAVICGVIVVVFAWAGLHDYRRRGRGARPSVAEKFRRQTEIDGQKFRGGDIGGGGSV